MQPSHLPPSHALPLDHGPPGCAILHDHGYSIFTRLSYGLDVHSSPDSFSVHPASLHPTYEMEERGE